MGWCAIRTKFREVQARRDDPTKTEREALSRLSPTGDGAVMMLAMRRGNQRLDPQRSRSRARIAGVIHKPPSGAVLSMDEKRTHGTVGVDASRIPDMI